MEFLFDNPFILVILIGIISSFFKKTKEAQQQREKEGKPKPQRTQGTPLPVGKNRPGRGHEQKPTKSSRQQPTKRVSQETDTFWEDQNEGLEQHYAALKHQHDEELYNTNEKQRVPNERNRIYADAEEANNKTLNMDSNALIDGLIWSEVLGPPRAKKAHRAVK